MDYLNDCANIVFKYLHKSRYDTKWSRELRHFDIFSIYNFGLNDKLLRILKGLHFKTNSMARKIERLFDGEWPLLIRPVRKRFVDNDWFIEDLDIRDIESWQIKSICSDAV